MESNRIESSAWFRSPSALDHLEEFRAAPNSPASEEMILYTVKTDPTIILFINTPKEQLLQYYCGTRYKYSTCTRTILRVRIVLVLYH
jgi:hypothetical protein